MEKKCFTGKQNSNEENHAETSTINICCENNYQILLANGLPISLF